jgi:hypothetical protein
MSTATVAVRGTALVPGKPDEIELWLVTVTFGPEEP